MNQHRLLIVEDEAIVALDIRDRLAGLGYVPVGHAMTGEQALELTRDLRPHLVLMDIRLQDDMDGIAAATEIRRRFQVPVIFLTAFAEDDTLERAKLAEPYGFILKPFDDLELKSAIEIALYKHRSEAEIRHINRLYDVLSQVNQTVARAQSREELFSGICRVLVERGRVELAWIGWLAQDAHLLQPVAYCGRHHDLLAPGAFKAGDRPEGQGNSGEALRTGEASVCNRCGGINCLHPHVPDPERLGFQSCGSFPLRFQGRVCGTLNICAAEPDFWSRHEIELLNEIALDITFALDKIEAEAQKQRQSEFLHTLLEALPLPVFYKDAQLRYLGCNAAYEDFQGVKRDWLAGKTAHDVWPRELADIYHRADQELLAHPGTQVYEGPTLTANGEQRQVIFHKAVFRDPDGALGGIIGIVENVTERQAAERALRESEERFRAMFELSSVGMTQADPQTGRFLRVNQKLCDITGYSADELLGMRLSEITHPEDRASDWEAFHGLMEGQESQYRREKRYIRKDGTVIWVNVNVTLYRDSADHPFYSLGVVEDITPRKLAQTELEKSLSIHQATLESTADGILVVDREQEIVSWNRKLIDMWRLPEYLVRDRDNVRLRTWASEQLVDPFSFNLRAQEIYLNPAEATFDVLHFKDGRVFERYTFPQYLGGQIVGRVLSFRDVTARVRAETALRESMAEYQRIVETAVEGIWVMDCDFCTTFINRQMAAMLGYDPKDLMGRSVTDFILPEDMADHRARLAQRRQGLDDTYERRLRRQDGSELWTIVSVRSLRGEGGEFQGSFAMFTDITQRKLAEDELKRSEQRVRAKLASILSPEGDISQLDLQDIIDIPAIQSLMDNFYQLTHLHMAMTDLKGNNLVAVGMQDICTKFHRAHPKAYQRCLQSSAILSQEIPPGAFKLYECLNHLWDIGTPVMVGDKHVGNLFMGQFLFADAEPDHEVFQAQAREFGFDEEAYLAALARVPRLDRQTADQAMAFFTKLANMVSLLSLSNIKLARAVAEQERLVESLCLSEEKSRADEAFLNDIFSSIKDGLTVFDLDRNILRVNPAMEFTFPGLPLVGRKCYEVFYRRDAICPNCPAEHTIKTGEASQAVLEVATGEEDLRFIEIFTYPYINRATGQVGGVIEYIRDITDRKHVEKALAKSHWDLQKTAHDLEQSTNMLQLVLESIPVRVFWKDRNFRYLGCNTLFARDAGCLHPRDLVGKNDFVMGWKDQAELYRQVDRQVMESRLPQMNLIEPQSTPSGNTIWLKTSKVPLSEPTGEVFGVLGVYEDITALKQQEDRLRASLQEKEVMLKEIHHRVKNNMQVISTLFDLQLKYSRDQDPPTLFRDCQNRIRSMALIHESLYHTDTLASINFRKYLEKLVNRLVASFGSSVQGIKVTVIGANLHLGINQAVPAGLVASELIVNCLKHAFPDHRPGEIHISLEEADGRRLIEIRDNGVGLDLDLPLDNPTTFGWLMISNLMKQLDGTITVTIDGGTICRMVF
jgi:PAS domain S-box-containing protein